ncbi:hypothetical protein [Tessaracoccus antarcticus]|nr:hypothetical protein [Tessaracoccus antarcticus]
MEQDPDVAARRALLTTRATGWAIGQMRRQNASVQPGPAARLHLEDAVAAVKPVLEAAAADEARG